MGRPSAFKQSEISIPLPEEPFLLAQISIARANSRCADELYGTRHKSLLQMRNVTNLIYDDLTDVIPIIEKSVGCPFHIQTRAPSVQVRQGILKSCVFSPTRPYLLILALMLNSVPSTTFACLSSVPYI